MKLLYIRKISHGRHTMYYATSCIRKCMLPTGSIQITFFYPYSLKQFNLLVTFGLGCSETPSCLKAALKKLLPVRSLDGHSTGFNTV